MEKTRIGINALPAITRPASLNPYLLYALFFALCLLAAFALAKAPASFDLPVIRWVNGFASRSYAADKFFYDIDRYYIFSGVLLMTLICFCWFASGSAREQARVLVGALLAFPAGVVSRFLQHTLPTHSRPFYDPLAAFQNPSDLPRLSLNTWNSFPSDHATTFGALATVILISRPQLAWVLVPYYAVLEFARLYMGIHYPTDLIAGTALGATVICVCQMNWVLAIGERAVIWSKAHPAPFYALAFMLSYQVATLFGDVRDIVGGFTIIGLS